MAYAMTYATHDDMQTIRRHVSDEDFREALDRAPPGIIDPRSWAYWNSKMGRYPPPPLPKRHERVAKHGSKCGSYNLKRTWRRSEGAHARTGSRRMGREGSKNQLLRPLP